MIFQDASDTEINTFSLKNNAFNNSHNQNANLLDPSLHRHVHVFDQNTNILDPSLRRHLHIFHQNTKFLQTILLHLTCYMDLYTFDTKTLLSLIKLLIEKPGSKTVASRGAATNLKAIHLNIV